MLHRLEGRKPKPTSVCYLGFKAIDMLRSRKRRLLHLGIRIPVHECAVSKQLVEKRVWSEIKPTLVSIS
jgi:hypothetical protein